jgi:hypothetical protein
MKRTKNARLNAVLDKFRESIGGRPFTTIELSNYILDNRLWPVPTIRDDIHRQYEWEERFSQIGAEA